MAEEPVGLELAIEEQKLRELEQEVQARSDELDRREAELTVKEGAVRDRERHLHALDENTKTLRADNASLSRENDQLAGDLKGGKTEQGNLRVLIRDARAECDQARARNVTLLDEVAGKRDKINLLTKQRDSASDKVTELRYRVGVLETVKAELERDLSTATAVIRQKSEALLKAQRELERGRRR